MILADTSVWIDHLRKGIPRLAELLESGEAIVHPFVIGEIACGELARRGEVLDLISRLPSAALATDEEVLRMIERHRLMGKGPGYIDVHLLAAVLLTPDSLLWTRDKRLAAVATRLRIAFDHR